MDDMMKPIAEMTLSECNAEIETAGGQAKKRIDHARNLVGALRGGKTTGAAAAAASAKRAVRKTRTNTTVATPGQPALTSEQAENTNTEPDKGGEEAPVAKKAAKKTARKQGPKANRTSKGKSIIPDSYRSQYKKDKGKKTESGSVAVHNGDGLASRMAGLDNDAIAKVGRENKVDMAKWAKLNNGQIRMNLGNVLRGMIRRGEDVTIQGKAVKSVKS